MQRDHEDTNDLIELGSVSGDTQGGAGNHWEGAGFEIIGISPD